MNAAVSNWLVLVATLPTEDPAARMRVLRTLESLGAAVIREGVFLLPDTGSNRQGLEALADYITRNAGTGHVLRVAGSPEQQQPFSALFDRSARYETLIKTVESLRVSFGHSDPAAISRVLHKQKRELDSIAELDFFPTAARQRARETLAEAEGEVRKLLFSTSSTQAAMQPGESLLGRTWATRKPLGADRLACAWLIRRFVDPEATLVWLEKAEPTPEGAIGFAFEGAHFTHGDAGVTYEEMLARLDLAKNAALAKIGGIVHFLEVRGAPVPEAAGVQTLLQGAQRRAESENELLAETEKTFDLLYEAYFDTSKPR